MYPAANPDPPLLAGAAALICALGGLGQKAEGWGATAMAGGPAAHPAPQPCGQWRGHPYPSTQPEA